MDKVYICTSDPSITYTSENGLPVPCKKGGADTPLILDVNRDGIISTTKERGVNLNRNRPDRKNGAATGGDKMLAMCDWDKNDMINYREVFGDGTWDPFQEKPVNASNGFIALHRIAISASQRFPDLKLLSSTKDGDTLVNLPQLQIALQRIQCDLGFISDDNILDLEPLGDVVWIKVTNYLISPNDGHNGIVFAQKSWFMDSFNQRWGVDDVWFPA